MASSIRFYFGEELGSLTRQQLLDRQAFLNGQQGGIETRGNSSGAIAGAAAALMEKTGRKEIPLGECIGMIG